MRLAVLSLVTLAGTAACSSGARSSGQTGSIGPSNDECRTAADCAQHSADELTQFTQATTSSHHFSTAECAPVGVVGGPSGPTCVCHEAEGSGTLDIGPAGQDCFVLGRGGDCLWQGSDFQGCDVTDPTSCDGVCADLQARLEADAARTFDAQSLYATCDAGTCRSVVELDDRCFADRSYTVGRAYDCSLGGEAILTAEKQAQNPPKPDELMEDRSPYVPGTDGFVSLSVYGSHNGTRQAPTSFGAFAEFVDPGGGSVSFGESIDPLEGIDDCGVFKGSGSGAGGPNAFFDAAEVALLDGDTVRPFALSEASNARFYSYVAELDDVAPRFGERYGVHVAGGSFGSTFDSPDGLELPLDFRIPELEATVHVEQQDLSLTWSGHGAEPLSLYLFVTKTLDGSSEPTELRCLMKDDGAFTIPAAVLQAMPTGFATAIFERATRHIVKSAARSLLLTGSVQQQHRFVLGPSCDGSASVAACQQGVSAVSAAYSACGLEPPAAEDQCPSFLATSCDACPEYFECAAKQTRCAEDGFYTAFGCACPH